MSSQYKTFEAWLDDFKRGAAETNPQLEPDEKGTNFIDFMEHTPLKRGFAAGVDPLELGRSFGAQFDVIEFLARGVK